MTSLLDPHWASSALAVVDVQVDFLDVPGTREVLPALRALVGAYRRAGRPVAHTIRLYEPGGADVDLPRRAAVAAGAHLVAPGTPGAEVVAGLLPAGTTLDAARLLTTGSQDLGPDETVFYKPRWSAFHRTALEPWLRARAVDTLVVAGCNLPNCPRATLFDASERDFRAVLPPDAVSQASPERLADLELIGVRLVPVAQVLSSLAGRSDG